MAMRILVVDDEPDVEPMFRQRFRRELRAGQIELAFAQSARQALDLLGAEDGGGVMLILSDINMPGMTGLDLLQEVKARFPHLRVAMVTAYDDDRTVAEARRRGADDLLSKPLDFAELKARVLDAV